MMPRKEQTCRNCAGDCCSIVSFMRPDGASSQPYSIMSFTVQELKASGFVEVYNPHMPCIAKSKYGCLIYDRRPRLCQSYFCHGRLWRAALTVNTSSLEAINPLPAKPQHDNPELPLPQTMPFQRLGRQRKYL
jgi:hypothetical protein